MNTVGYGVERHPVSHDDPSVIKLELKRRGLTFHVTELDDQTFRVSDPLSSSLCHAEGASRSEALENLSLLRAIMRFELSLTLFNLEPVYRMYRTMRARPWRPELEQELQDALDVYEGMDQPEDKRLLYD